MFGQLSSDSEAIIKHITELVYFMRGAISYDDMLMYRTYAERTIIGNFIQKRMEVEAKSPHPVY